MTMTYRTVQWLLIPLALTMNVASAQPPQVAPPAPAQVAPGPAGQDPRQFAPGSFNAPTQGGRAVARRPGRKNVLAWVDVQNGFQHDSISHAVSTIERLGYESGLYDTFIRSDSQVITKHGLFGADGQVVYGHDLNDYDAIFFFGVREIDLRAQQRADLISFVKDDGKGFVAAHAGGTAFMSWPEFGEMLGGRFDEHPWGMTDETLLIEAPDFPGLQQLPRVLSWRDEAYQVKEFARDKVDVLIRLDVSKMDLSGPLVHRRDGDFPQAWAKTYGNGRVYYNALGHDITAWDNPAIQRMYFEAIKWALRLQDAPVRPHPIVQVNGTPQPLK